MPIAKLFVEGSLEIQVLTPIFLGNPVPQQGGSKNSLKARAGVDRRENKVSTGYLRDRDFDFDPPADLSRPVVDSVDGAVPFGWRWCRHETENYLLEPGIVCEALNCPVQEYDHALKQAAARIKHYEAARWAIGIVRRSLPPHFDLKTRPDALNEIDVPEELDLSAVNAWVLRSVSSHRAPIAIATDPVAVQTSFDAMVSRFDDRFLTDSVNILVWFSGKDLLAGLSGWLDSIEMRNPGEFRAFIRDWMIANPARTIELLPEWRQLCELLRA